MCTELFLAILYFLTILIVNYFLYKLLLNYFSKIISLLKIKNILNNYKKQNLFLFLTTYNSEKIQSKSSLKLFNNLLITKDRFLIGNSYKYLVNLLEREKNLDITTLYYLKLLENQYLSNKIELK